MLDEEILKYMLEDTEEMTESSSEEEVKLKLLYLYYINSFIKLNLLFNTLS